LLREAVLLKGGDVAEFIVRIGERNLDGELTWKGIESAFMQDPASVISLAYIITP
jgi:hypothetical protein